MRELANFVMEKKNQMVQKILDTNSLNVVQITPNTQLALIFQLEVCVLLISHQQKIGLH